MLKVSLLEKKFGNKIIVNKISFALGESEVVGIIGPNGSGKTTLLNIIMGMLAPTSGSVHFESTRNVGMAVSRNGFFGDMTVMDNLLIYAKLGGAGREKVISICNEFGIDYGSVQFNQLSSGMKQRVTLVLAFLFESKIILLDEPSNHLDIDSLLTLRNKILQDQAKGVSFLVTSHVFTDLEKICNRILFLKNGNLVGDRATVDLLHEYGSLEEAYLSIR